MKQPQDNRLWHFFIYALLGACSILLFLKNAWVAEDAFIILRSVDQFLHGHGFRWNPQDRTQVYTSPLWFLLVIASTLFCKTLYLNLIGLSLVLHVALLTLMARLIKNIWHWSAAVLLLTLSQSFFDFTASGLEYPLVFLLLGSFVLFYLRNQHLQDRFWLAASAGLALVTRHDLLFILSPMLLHLGWRFYRELPRQSFVAMLGIFLLPITGWTLFSLLYYGVPFPNTAYAKLAIPGVSEADRLRRGYIYLSVSLQMDPLTPILLAIASLHLLCDRQTSRKMLGAGILVNFLFVCWIGGDYMIGRFYAPIYLAAVLGLTAHNTTLPLAGRMARCLLVIPLGQLVYWLIAGNLTSFLLLLQRAGLPQPASATPVLLLIALAGFALAIASWRSTRCSVATTALFACLLFYSTQQNDSPWQTPYRNWGKTADQALWWMVNEVTRERYWTFRWTSLNAWTERDPAKPFPDHPWCNEGRELPGVAKVRFSGMMCYCMGTDRIAIDVTGLTDPLIARMPKHPDAVWSSGGAVRIVPDGYEETLSVGKNRIADPDLALYYDKLALITQSDQLFSLERLTTIIAFNLGHYDHWLDSYKQRALQNIPPRQG
ncbi:MAG TPA: hypothetical protein PLF22_10040 [Pseudomonadales bacterium]|nr:hypothetical protein [Pseudomonadales bacterium]